MQLVVLVWILFTAGFTHKRGVAVVAHDGHLFSTDECGKSKGCLLKPDKCPSSDTGSNCTYALSYSFLSSGEVEIEVQAKRPAQLDANGGYWVAVGFSKSKRMPETAVTACVWIPRQNKARLLLQYNDGYTSKKVQIDNNTEKQLINLVDSSFTDGNLYCRFKQQLAPATPSPEIFDLSKPYYLIITGGNADVDDVSNIELKIHDTKKDSQLFPLVSNDLVALNSSAVLSSARSTVPDWVKPILMKCHGILMIFGWWLFVPTAIIFARYFRNMWPNTKFLGIKVWFHLHRGLQVFAVLQVVTAFVCVLVAKEGVWVGDRPSSRTHAVSGLTCFIAILFEPVFALFRCHPGTKWRPLFNWPHRLIGLTAFCVACTAIWWSTYFHMGLNYDHFGDAPRALMIFYWVILCAVALALEIHITLTERFRVLKPKHKVATELSMQTPGSRDPDSTAPDYSPQWALTRGLLLGLFVLCATGVTVALAAFIGVTGH